MISEKLVKRIGTISKEFEKLGYNFRRRFIGISRNKRRYS